MAKKQSPASDEKAKKQPETLVQKMCRCTVFSKRRAEKFLADASSAEKSAIQKCEDSALAAKLHELVSAREKKKPVVETKE